MSSIGRIAQDAEGVGQRPAARYTVDGNMTARRFAARSSPSSDGGKGQALIFTDGVARAGVWQRTSNADTWNLYTDETLSEPIGLSDGRTWVELPRNDSENVRYVS